MNKTHLVDTLGVPPNWVKVKTDYCVACGKAKTKKKRLAVIEKLLDDNK